MSSTIAFHSASVSFTLWAMLLRACSRDFKELLRIFLNLAALDLSLDFLRSLWYTTRKTKQKMKLKTTKRIPIISAADSSELRKEPMKARRELKHVAEAKKTSTRR